MRSYTKDEHGRTTDDFTATTTIRKAEADQAVLEISGEVSAAVGELAVVLEPLAASVTALGAAAQAVVDLDGELSARLRGWYEDGLARLKVAARDERDGTLDGRARRPATWEGPDAWDQSRRAY
ncbi:hypothetical protein [Euzebya sp.]|uniref:hypothetical protein n=1 Tax=Euzebya sp. TaxID=1971409 RepID=UPI0035112685